MKEELSKINKPADVSIGHCTLRMVTSSINITIHHGFPSPQAVFKACDFSLTHYRRHLNDFALVTTIRQLSHSLWLTAPRDLRYNSADRQKKIDALKAQADERAKQLKAQLEERRQEALAKEQKVRQQQR